MAEMTKDDYKQIIKGANIHVAAIQREITEGRRKIFRFKENIRKAKQRIKDINR